MSRIDRNHGMRHTFAALAVALGAIFAATTADARSIMGVERIVSLGEMFLNVTFEAGEPSDSHALYIAYDTEDKGETITNWAALQRGCVVAHDAKSATIPVSPLLIDAGYTVCRVFLTTSVAPYDTLIESLRQTGTQYIDSEIKPNQTTIVSLDFQFSNVSTEQQRVFGISSDTYKKGSKKYDDATAVLSFDAYINGSLCWASACKNGKGDWLTSEVPATTDRMTITLDATTGDHTVSNHVSGAVKTTHRTTTPTETSAGTMMIFAQRRYTNGSVSIKNIAKGGLIYGGAITTNGAPARIYHPCMSGGRAGLYDEVSGKISYSAVATDFENGSAPVVCSLLDGETQLSAAPAAIGLISDYTWRGTAVNWGDVDAWTKEGDPAIWVTGNNAIFATANATATLAADVIANSIAFSADATVAGTSELSVKSVSVDSGVSATISAPIASAFEKTGAGVLTLTQDRTAATTVTEGTLKMDNATVADLTLGTDGGAPVTFDYGGQELVKNTRDYLVTGSTVTLTNGTFSTASGDDLNIRDDTFTMPSVLTIAKDAVVRQGAIGKSVYIVNVNGTATINVIGGTLGNTDGCNKAYLQHKSPAGGLNLNVSEGGLVYFPCLVYALCRGDIAVNSPSLYMTFANSAFSVGTNFEFGSSWHEDKYVPTAPTGVFAATNSVVSVGDGFIVGRNKRDSKTAGSLTVDFENCVVTAKTFAVYCDRPLNKARFNGTRFVFGAAGGSIVASDDAANWITVGDDGLTLDTQAYSATLNANLGGSGTVTKVGAGTLTVSRDQATTGGICVNEGTLAIDGSVTFAESVEFAADTALDIAAPASDVAAFAAKKLILPAEGAVKLTKSGGAFGEGVYAICRNSDVIVAEVEERFDVDITDMRVASWSKVDDLLVLTVKVIERTWIAEAGESFSWSEGWGENDWSDGVDAIFETAGAIASVDDDVAANSVKFKENAAINGESTLTPNIVYVAEGKEAVINAPTAGALTKTGAGTLTLGLSRSAETTLSEGTLAMSGSGTELDWSKLTLGTDPDKPVTVRFEDGAAPTSGAWHLGSGNIISTVVKASGDWSRGGNDIHIGSGVGADTTFIHDGGSLTCSRFIRVGTGGAANSTLILSGGVIKNTNADRGDTKEPRTAIGYTYDGTLIVTNGASLAVTGQYLGISDANGVKGIVEIYDGSTVDVAYDVIFGQVSTQGWGEGKLNLHTGGTLSTKTIRCSTKYATPADATAEVNFDGGILKANSSTLFIQKHDRLTVNVSAKGGTIDNNGKDISIEESFNGPGTINLIGSGSTTFAAGVGAEGGISVANDTTLTINGTAQSSFDSLTLAAGSTLNIANYDGTTPLSARALTLPDEGTVALTLNGGAFGKGVYAICSAQGVKAADGGKFAFTTTDDQTATWGVADGTLLLSVGGVSGNYWTGRGGDGRMSTAANWLNGVPAAGEDIDFSVISANTTIIADTGRAFGAVTMGDGVITFADLLAATSISDTSKVAVAADSTVTLEGDLVIDTTSGNKYIVNSVADGGKFKVTGKIRAIGTNNLWPSYVKTCNGAIEASGLVSAVSGSDLWSFRLSNSGGHIGKWIIGKDGFVCEDRAAGFWVHNNSNDRTEIQAAADFTIQDAWIGLSTKAKTFTIQTTSPDGIALTITAKTGFAAHSDGACSLDVRGSGTFLCDYTAQAFGNGGPKAFSGAITVNDTATFAVNSEKYPTTGAISVSSEATFKVAQSGVVTLCGNLSLADGAALGFNFTNRKVGPLLALASGKSLSFVGEGEKNIAVKVSGDVWPVGGKHILTATGGFNVEGVTVSLAEGAPKWAKSVYVNEDGNIVLDVKPRGTKVIVR